MNDERFGLEDLVLSGVLADGAPLAPTEVAKRLHEAFEVLSNLRLLWPRGLAAISGGFLRDLANRMQPKDMDVFVMADTPEGASPGMLTALANACGSLAWICDDYLNEYMDCGTCVRVSSSIPRGPTGNPYLVPLNVVILQHGVRPTDDARLNDFGICQTWLTMGGLDATDAYFTDAQDKTFTLSVCENYNQFQRSMRRWARLRRKYPDHKLVVPPRFAHHYEQYLLENPNAANDLGPPGDPIAAARAVLSAARSGNVN